MQDLAVCIMSLTASVQTAHSGQELDTRSMTPNLSLLASYLEMDSQRRANGEVLVFFWYLKSRL